jgi:hypothetical protein
MKNAKQQIDEALERLATDLEGGHSETLRRYLAVMGRFHQYSLGNQLLIAQRRPDATHVAGFQAWRRLGRWVKAGEHGIPILAPIMRKKRPHAKDPDDEPQIVAAFKGAYVFDITQTEGAALAEFAQVQGDPAEQLDLLKAFITAQGIALTFSSDLQGAMGLSAGGRIVIRSGMTPAETYSTLAHELGHEMLHRQDGQAVPPRVRELEAEAVAYVVCQAAGLRSGTASSDYVLLHQGDRKLLLASLKRIRQTAATIIGSLEQEGPRRSAQAREQPRKTPIIPAQQP